MSEFLPIDTIRPSPENEKLYRPVDPGDPDIRDLAESIRRYGVREPLVVSADGWILSGHRRYVAAQLAGETCIPCRREPIRRADDPDGFLVLLREHNRQRVKSFDEKLREEVVSAHPGEAYRALIAHRRAESQVPVETIPLREAKTRARMSKAKMPFLNAVLKIVDARQDFWPLSDRQIHYALLNDPPLIHAGKPDSTYTNNLRSYKALTDLLTRARLQGHLPWGAIADPTRPTRLWPVHQDVQGFIRSELGRLFKNYWRNLMQSQPNHIEIVGEKLTIQSIIQSVAARYTIPVTIGRGFASLDARYRIVARYRATGKERLILLLLADFDPDGEEIAHSFARSIRDDFGVERVEAVKVALTADQVKAFALPPILKAKESSSRYGRFVDRFGSNVFELEAVPPQTLQQLLTQAIDNVMDIGAFNREVDQEWKDAATLDTARRRVQAVLGAEL